MAALLFVLFLEVIRCLPCVRRELGRYHSDKAPAALRPNLEYHAAMAAMMIATVVPPSVIPMAAAIPAAVTMPVTAIAITPAGTVVIAPSARSLLLHKDKIRRARYR